ncbi:hypothetical protein B0H11DRAFT_1909420 [Mycena galericulata]|nr:hypothetical protein B0H11DRAFT_1909420 [Mycena galericulata]
MVLIEDLTGPSIGPKNDRVQGVTLPGLLNALDGVTAPERGVTFFVTTNDIDGLDPALTGPGRLGYHLKFHSATSGQIHSMLAAHYPGCGPETLQSMADNIEPGATAPSITFITRKPVKKAKARPTQVKFSGPTTSLGSRLTLG